MTTEEQILVAARKVFIEKGFEGTRMQEIANEAGINKALLHYYFRTKEKLFEQIFTEVFQKIKPAFSNALHPDPDFQAFTNAFIEGYLNLLDELPFLPRFVIQELNRDPKRFVALMEKQEIPFDSIRQMIQCEVDKKTIQPIAAEQFIINLIALIVFPYIAQALVKDIFFNKNEAAYHEFLSDRKQKLADFVFNGIGFKKAF